MQDQEVQKLLEKYQAGTCTDREKALLESWYLQRDVNAIKNLTEKEFAEDLVLIGKDLPLHQAVRKSLWPRIAAAASILIFLSFGAYFLLRNFTLNQEVAKKQIQDIGPGSNKLILTLGSGKKIDLTTSKNGRVAAQGQTAINKLSNGQVVYITTNNANQEVQYNTVSAPRGGTGTITLADGTQVWLNAESSITFPTVFKGISRMVSITGDVIIKPVMNINMPFFTKVRNQIVKDVGTEFDINAYNNESAIKTTLIEGSVSIAANGKTVVLKPGQQSVLSGNNLQVGQGNIRDATAWRDGELRCDGENIQTIMRMIERWYNVDVVYQGKISADSYYGTISRYKNISQALHMLSYSNQVHFKIEGRRVTVME